MRLWAYGTSPHGLGLSSRRFWMLSPREYYVLQDVQQAPTERWAIGMAAYHNGTFVTDDVPWTADDFLGKGNRETRKWDRKRGDMAAQQQNSKLLSMVARPTRDDELDPEGLPVWARKDFGKRKKV